ncbi:MAG: PaaI family thioesterase [Nocardioidaceae bacterium]
MSGEDLQGGLIKTLGITYDDIGADRVQLRLEIRPELLQPFGILHGGVHCSLVETAASVAAAMWWGERGQVVGVSNQTDFLRAASDGVITAVATPIHRGRSQQLWQVEITDESDRLLALGKVRLHNLTVEPTSAP